MLPQMQMEPLWDTVDLPQRGLKKYPSRCQKDPVGSCQDRTSHRHHLPVLLTEACHHKLLVTGRNLPNNHICVSRNVRAVMWTVSHPCGSVPAARKSRFEVYVASLSLSGHQHSSTVNSLHESSEQNRVQIWLIHLSRSCSWDSSLVPSSPWRQMLLEDLLHSGWRATVNKIQKNPKMNS